VHEPADSEDDSLTPKQYFEKQIRIRKWNRALVFKLGLTPQERKAYALWFIGLQGCAARLRQAMCFKKNTLSIWPTISISETALLVELILLRGSRISTVMG